MGCGTFGVVHKGKWKNADVAVKYFNNKTISSDPSFKREVWRHNTIGLHMKNGHESSRGSGGPGRAPQIRALYPGQGFGIEFLFNVSICNIVLTLFIMG